MVSTILVAAKQFPEFIPIQIQGPPSRYHLGASHRIGLETRTKTAGSLENAVPGKGNDDAIGSPYLRHLIRYGTPVDWETCI